MNALNNGPIKQLPIFNAVKVTFTKIAANIFVLILGNLVAIGALATVYFGIGACIIFNSAIAQSEMFFTQPNSDLIRCLEIIGVIVSRLALFGMGIACFFLFIATRTLHAQFILNVYDGERLSWARTKYVVKHKSFTMLGTWFLRNMINQLALLLFLPFFIFFMRLGIADFCVLEQQCGPVDALEKSFKITSGNTLRLLCLCVIFSLPLAVVSQKQLFELIHHSSALMLCIVLTTLYTISCMLAAHIYRFFVAKPVILSDEYDDVSSRNQHKELGTLVAPYVK